MTLENATETENQTVIKEKDSDTPIDNNPLIKFCLHNLKNGGTYHHLHDVFLEFKHGKYTEEQLDEALIKSIEEYGPALAKNIINYMPLRRRGFNRAWLAAHGFGNQNP